ncbi:hypothetical protein VNO80_00344 [Phaseolus coccineus]|uniref:Uncharacterized protein n=1 Tax=Phaseolus coccineus TaxID=3886 RepID=A0AAN9RR69_PHACN
MGMLCCSSFNKSARFSLTLFTHNLINTPSLTLKNTLIQILSHRRSTVRSPQCRSTTPPNSSSSFTSCTTAQAANPPTPVAPEATNTVPPLRQPHSALRCCHQRHRSAPVAAPCITTLLPRRRTINRCHPSSSCICFLFFFSYFWFLIRFSLSSFH